MNISLIDEYVYLVLVDNGWTEKRDFLLADSWIEKIERKSDMQCFEYAGKILHLFGGVKFKEFSPKTGQYFLEKCGGDEFIFWRLPQSNSYHNTPLHECGY